MPSAVSGCGCEENVVLLRELFEVGSGVPFRDLVARSSRQQRLLWDWERVTVLAFASGGSRGARPALPLAVSAAARHGRWLVRMFLSQPDLSHLVLLVTHLSPFRPCSCSSAVAVVVRAVSLSRQRSFLSSTECIARTVRHNDIKFVRNVLAYMHYVSVYAE